MKNLIIIILVLVSQTANSQTPVIVKWNGGFGSLIDSIKTNGKTYGQSSLLSVSGTSGDIVVYVTSDNNGAGDTDVSLTLTNGFVSDKITIRKQPRKDGSRQTKATFKNVDILKLKSIILTDH